MRTPNRARVIAGSVCSLAVLGLAACGDQLPAASLPADTPAANNDRPLVTVDLSQFPEAVREEATRLIEAVNAAPDDGQSAGLAGIFAHAHERPDMAMTYYRRASELEPETFQWPYLNGILLADAGDDGAAAASFEKAARLNAEYPPLMLRQARLLLKAGDVARAQALLTNLVASRPDYAEAQFALGQLHLNAEKAQDAIGPLTQAVQRVPHYGSAHYALASAHEKTGNAAAAATHRALFEKHKRGAPPQVDRILTRVQDMRGSSRQAVIRAGRLSAAGQFAEAAEIFERLIVREANNPVPYINLIGLYGEMGDIEKARDAYERGLAVAPSATKLHSNYGVLLLRNSDNEGAATAFEKAIELDDTQSGAHKFLGFAQQRLGDDEAAIASLARAFELDALDDRAGFALGTAQLAAGQFEAAVDTLSQTLEPVSQRTSTYLRALAQARLSAGDPAGAGEALTRARAVATEFDQTALIEEIDAELKQLAEAGVAAP